MAPAKTFSRRAVIGLSAGLAVVVALLVVVATGRSGQRSSSAAPAPSPTSASAAQLARACIERTKGQEAVVYFQRDIPAGRWGDRVRGTASTTSEPHVLWLFDADCTAHRALEVPPRTSRTFTAQVGQVWYYAAASAKQPTGECDCRVFSPSSGGEQRFSDAGSITYHLD
ncbi:hypothetical protein ABZS77_17775 [Micromonospora sp. NPDC005298]|uniref:hypothetical protein n=1 Tax=Micromonospora sp. NPDC005298 TaxID=3156873 RepID=UPI0033B0BB87